jgi:hypothetical protein
MDRDVSKSKDCQITQEDVILGYSKSISIMNSEIARLKRAIIRYLDNPGCNVPSRQRAMEQLRFEVEKK